MARKHKASKLYVFRFTVEGSGRFPLGEHELVEKLRESHREMVVAAKKSIARDAHEAKASTKLKHLRKDIARAEKDLKKLRAEEKKLARQAEREAAAS